MKIVGITFMWVGGLYLLQNLGIIPVIGWSVVWPVAVIILGISLKHTNRGMICGFGGKCGMGGCGKCGSGDGHKCEGGECGTCKK